MRSISVCQAVEVNGALYWDVLRLFHELKQGIRVAAGPSEGTGLGNILCQLIALNVVKNDCEAKKIVLRSVKVEDFTTALIG